MSGMSGLGSCFQSRWQPSMNIARSGPSSEPDGPSRIALAGVLSCLCGGRAQWGGTSILGPHSEVPPNQTDSDAT